MTSFSDAFFSPPAMCAALSDEAHLRAMVAFETALALAESEAGAIPPEAGPAIAAALKTYDIPHGASRDALFADAAKAGTLAIPFIKLLTQAVKAQNPQAASFVHFGATSQDVIDTALHLQLVEAVAQLDADLLRMIKAAAKLSLKHRNTIMLGRTLLQPATPITFGLKAAQWGLAAYEVRQRLQRAAEGALTLQCGGAAGTLGALGEKGIAVANAMQKHFALPLAPTHLPAHTRHGARAALGAEIGILAGICGKIARDISLMMQLEVAECFEAPEAGRGGSSAMPHKRNPVRCMQTLSAATRAPGLVATLMSTLVQEHERALGSWQAEWATLPELFKLTAGALANMAETLEGLIVDEARMRQNFDALKGLPMTEAVSLALAPKLGRAAAHEKIEAAARATASSDQTLGQVLRADADIARHLSADDLAKILDPLNALGSTQAFIDEALSVFSRAQ